MIREDGDQTLLRASCTGDTDAFAKLYEKYQRDVYAVCLAILQDPCLAEDALQDTFLRAFLGLSRFKPGKPLGPWLRTIARRRCADIRRRTPDASLEGLIESGVNLGLDGQDQFSDATFDEAINAQRLAKLRLALATLSSRQRRALLLQAVEGWSHADIAEVDGISIDAVNMLLVRARKKLRQAWDAIGGAFGLGVAPWRGLRYRLQAAIARVQRNSASAISDGWLTTGGLALVGAGVALVMAAQLPSQAPALAGGPAEGPSAPQALQQIGGTSGQLPAGQAGTKSRKAPENAGASSLLPELTELAYLGPESTPENTFITSIEPSPDYEEDHTVFAVSDDGCAEGRCRLFVTRDGGASWERMPAQGLAPASTLLIPPDYLRNGIFVMSVIGLQRSLDGGKTFASVSPVSGLAAISPAFKDGDRRIIIAGKNAPALYEYLVDQSLTGLLISDLSYGGRFTSLGLSPRFPFDSTILTGRSRLQPSLKFTDYEGNLHVNGVGSNAGSLQSCTADRCDDVLSESPRQIQFSPSFDQGGTVYSLLWGNKLVRSKDMRNYQYLDVSKLEAYLIGLEISPSLPLKIFLVKSRGPGVSAANIYHSEDGGITWAATSHNPGFVDFKALTAVSSSRLFALPFGQGIACSQDGGGSWQPRCLPEP